MAQVEPIPVVVVTEAGHLLGLDANTALLRMPANSGHGHPDGRHCVACATHTDVRALLYDMLEEVKLGRRPRFTKVLVDAGAEADPPVVVAALTGKLPAQALRDHTVARLFYLADAA
ncbi:MAG: hypothetical protein MO852_13875 [Candidatus Devosia euplotis]|nr:hypothetical protein [Candidatus Devosia euplotis]